MVILGIRNEINRGSNMGRETFIAPLSWEREPFEWKENKDLWPVVSPISGKVEKENEVIFTNSTQINSYNFRDDFNSKMLGLKWNFRRLPLKNTYSLDKREGFLRIFSHQNIIKESNSVIVTVNPEFFVIEKSNKDRPLVSIISPCSNL